MIVKKSLKSRIRGWFPQEPKLPKAPAKTDFQTNSPPILKAKPTPTQMAPGTVRTIRSLGFQAIFWTIFSFLFINQIRVGYHISSTLQIAWITAGLILGLLFSAVFTHRQIGYFEKNSQFPTQKAGPVFAAIVGVIIIMVVVYLSMLIFLPSVGVGFLSSVFATAPTFFATRYLMFLRYEEKKEIFIVQYWWQAGLFALPKKAPDI